MIAIKKNDEVSSRKQNIVAVHYLQANLRYCLFFHSGF